MGGRHAIKATLRRPLKDAALDRGMTGWPRMLDTNPASLGRTEQGGMSEFGRGLVEKEKGAN